MADPAGKPKPAFFIAVLVVVAGLGAFSFYRCNAKKTDTPKGQTDGSDKIDMKSIKTQAGGSGRPQTDELVRRGQVGGGRRRVVDRRRRGFPVDARSGQWCPALGAVAS